MKGAKRIFYVGLPILFQGDYCNVSEGANFGMLVKVVLDTVIKSGQFEEFHRKDTLFMARKKDSVNSH